MIDVSLKIVCRFHDFINRGIHARFCDENMPAVSDLQNSDEQATRRNIMFCTIFTDRKTELTVRLYSIKS